MLKRNKNNNELLLPINTGYGLFSNIWEMYSKQK